MEDSLLILDCRDCPQSVPSASLDLTWKNLKTWQIVPVNFSYSYNLKEQKRQLGVVTGQHQTGQMLRIMLVSFNIIGKGAGVDTQ